MPLLLRKRRFEGLSSEVTAVFWQNVGGAGRKSLLVTVQVRSLAGGDGAAANPAENVAK
mgnify:CR=1 FL=1